MLYLQNIPSVENFMFIKLYFEGNNYDLKEIFLCLTKVTKDKKTKLVFFFFFYK